MSPVNKTNPRAQPMRAKTATRRPTRNFAQRVNLCSVKNI
jgi:hypothetical protein